VIPNEDLANGMSQEFDGKIVLVTGSARGIGRNISGGLARAGASVLIADVNAAAGQIAADELDDGSGRVSYLPADLAADDGPELLIDRVVKQFGRLDVLVNNARSRPQGKPDIWTENRLSWDDTMAVTLRGTFFMARAALRHWKASPTPDAAIVNIASISGMMSTNDSPAYHAAKGGVIQLTRYLADVAGPLGARVNAVAPGFVVQDEHRERYLREDNEKYRTVSAMAHPLGRVGASDEIAQAILFLASPRSAFVTGQIMVVDGGASIQDQWTLLDRTLPAFE